MKDKVQFKELGAMPCYGSLPDYAKDDAEMHRLMAEAAVAHIMGDMAARTAARNRIAALKAKRPFANAYANAHCPWASDGVAVGGGNANSNGICWYCRAPEGNPLRESLDALARLSGVEAAKNGFDRRDVFAAVLYRYGELLHKEPELPDAKLVSRSLAWAQHHLMREDFAEHHARERNRDPEGYRKWTWKLTDEVVEAIWPGLRAALTADATSAEADATVLVEDLAD